ncbi:MAG TPA: 7,8-didemethyl-8-hydroxy-5-deazariboflavin synthase CofG, partial [Tepidiformaceae bacterium]|nr:7,8-didemethyl-8-hydroxy-5-deazariboflavin synthase CofG [Tepidiformaceae bacterium]
MLDTTGPVLAAALNGERPSHSQALALADEHDLQTLLPAAAELRDRGHRNVVSYSKKVFIPLTHLCRDVCHYCTFARPPIPGQRAYMTPEEVLEIARAGAAQGCKEALFTLGDKPELRYKVARRELDEMGYASTIAYLTAMAKLVFEETGLLPHANPGVMTRHEIAALREVTISQGIMLESVTDRLHQKGQVHYGSPDKHPAPRLQTMRDAGELQVPFTSGILIGIGETRRERIESFLALRDLNDEFGHIQEIIVQNFRAKPGTKMEHAPEPDLDDLLWSIAVARVVFGPEMNIQAPPNLSYEDYPKLVQAGLNDWGGVSPVTPDHVNPEAPWPHLEELREHTAECGKVLTERLAVYPEYALDSARWQSPAMATAVVRAVDGDGFARTDAWSPGDAETPPPAADIPKKLDPSRRTDTSTSAVRDVLSRAEAGADLSEADLILLFQARGHVLTEHARAAR